MGGKAGGASFLPGAPQVAGKGVAGRRAGAGVASEGDGGPYFRPAAEQAAAYLSLQISSAV